MSIGERLKYLRKKHKYSQIELGLKIGIDHSGISKLESGKRPVDHNELIAFCNFYRVSADYLLGIKKDEEIENTESFPDSEWTEEEQIAAEAFVIQLRKLRSHNKK